jgi:hypothetical protein
LTVAQIVVILHYYSWEPVIVVRSLMPSLSRREFLAASAATAVLAAQACSGDGKSPSKQHSP